MSYMYEFCLHHKYGYTHDRNNGYNTRLHSSAAILNIVDAPRQNSCRNVPFVMRKILISLPVSAMIGEQGNI